MGDEMKVNLNGRPEDLIQRCDICEYCIFEDILSKEQRKIKVLDLEIPENHLNRITIEQLCGMQYDKVCPMKYVAMRASCDDRTAMQMGVVNIFVWDLGKQQHQKIDFNQALANWTKDQDLGRGITESYAKRYEEIWNRGIRQIKNNSTVKKKQILTADHIYEIVIAKPHTYEQMLTLLDTLIAEHKERDAF
ncbi:MAG: hypothetical protein K9M57_01560 [Phycisphaerae bacterium]|nr:hypothetical protein [Phycisphaerae bacterium]